MSLENYCRREGLDRLWDRLKTWFDGLDGEWRFKLVRRNIDREFDLREDLDSGIKREFLDALAAMWETLEKEKHPRILKTYEELVRPHRLRFSPPNVITKVVQARPGDFLLKGRALSSRPLFSFGTLSWRSL